MGRGPHLFQQKQTHSVCGSFYIPHAETDTILLLQSSAYSEEHELDASRCQGCDGSRGLQQALEQAVGTSMALKIIWMPEDRLEPAGDEAMKKLCPNLTLSEVRLIGPFAITLDMAGCLACV